MGVEDFNEFLQRVGFVRGEGRLEPGGVLGVDAMWLLSAQHAVAAAPYIDALRSRYRGRGEAAALLRREAPDLGRERVFDAEGNLRPEAFAPPAPGEPRPPCYDVRREVAYAMAGRLAGFLAAGVTPVLVWDPPVAGGRRTPGKAPCTGAPMLLRDVDRTYVYAALRYAGFPTVVAWTEGEKCACAAAQAGACGAVLSPDTDCVVLGAPLIAAEAIPLLGDGVRFPAAVHRPELEAALARAGVPPAAATARLVDAAVFLGCDFCPRLPQNGPAKAARRTAPFLPEALAHPDPAYVAAVGEALRFFEVTPADRERAAALFRDAIAEGFVQRPDVLRALQLPDLLNYAELLGRGPPHPRPPRRPADLPPDSGAAEY